MDYEASLEFAQHLDETDEIREFRNRFNMPGEQRGRSNIYLCGNSLGLQPKRAVSMVQEELEEWGQLGVAGHFAGRRPWMPYHRNATKGLAYLAGAKASEVVAMNTLTVNLHVLMTTFYRPEPKRHKIVIESTAFPSDRYAVESQLRLHGYDAQDALLEWCPRDDEKLYLEDLESMLAAQADGVALMLLPGVQYYSGQVLDMPALCALARQYGCKIGLDLAHAIGNVPLRLTEWGPDFAAWCNYKYLNGGPGAVGGAFVHERHHDDNASQQLLGWWGHDEATRFRMPKTFTPAAGAERWQLSNIPVLSLAPVLASVELFEDAGIDRLRAKSERLTGFLAFLLEKSCAGQIRSITPENARGCQLSLVVRDDKLNARGVFDSLDHLNVTADWREPNVIRVAPVPMYNTFEEVYDFSARLRLAIDEND